MISRSQVRGASLVFLATGLAGVPLAAAELAVAIPRSYYLLAADGYHAAMDSLLAVVYALLLRHAYRRPRAVAWRLYNLESVATLLASVVLGYLLAQTALAALGGADAVPRWAAAFLAAGAAQSLASLALEARYVGLQLVRQDVAHASLDAAADGAAVAAVLSGSPALVEAAVLAVAALAAYQAARNSWEAAQGILGLELRGLGIRRAVEAELARLGLRPLRVYVARAGSFSLVEAVVSLPPWVTLGEAYRLKKAAVRYLRSIEGVLVADVRVVPRGPSYRPREAGYGGAARVEAGEVPA